MGKRAVQVVARHPLGLRSLWDERIADGLAPDGVTGEQLFTTWKIRTDGQSQRVIDYIWCVMEPPVQVPRLSMIISHYAVASTQFRPINTARSAACRFTTNLRPVQRWLTPTVHEIGPAALPYRAYPSDHVAVCCEFQIR